MARWLKTGADVTAVANADRAVRETVEGILADVAARGDAAVRDLSVKFDGWDRESFLGHTCVKAGLPADAWRQPGIEIAGFTATVFGEA